MLKGFLQAQIKNANQGDKNIGKDKYTSIQHTDKRKYRIRLGNTNFVIAWCVNCLTII